MGIPQLVDISEFNGSNIDFKAYSVWSKSGDGKSRICMRSSYGTGFLDKQFLNNQQNAIAFLDEIIYYHYAYPQYNDPTKEAAYFAQSVGQIRPGQDSLMLDIEEEVEQTNATWIVNFMTSLTQFYPKTPLYLYSNLSIIQNHLQDSRLASYPLVYALWNYNPLFPPIAPDPWHSWSYWQWTDKGSVPGITGNVDMWIGHMPDYEIIAMQDTWTSYANSVGKQPLDFNSRIAQVWKNRYPLQNFGSPMYAYQSIDWQGNQIEVMYFTGGVRAEHDTKSDAVRFYASNGTVLLAVLP